MEAQGDPDVQHPGARFGKGGLGDQREGQDQWLSGFGHLHQERDQRGGCFQRQKTAHERPAAQRERRFVATPDQQRGHGDAAEGHAAHRGPRARKHYPHHRQAGFFPWPEPQLRHEPQRQRHHHHQLVRFVANPHTNSKLETVLNQNVFFNCVLSSIHFMI